MLEDDALDLERADAVARALDHVVGASLEPEVAVGVTAGEVADRHPPAAHQLTRALGIVPVAQCIVVRRIRRHADLPDGARRVLWALLVDAGHTRPGKRQ